MPHISLWRPRYFTKVPDGLQTYTGVLKSPLPDQEGQKLGSTSDTRDFNNIETLTVIKVFFFLQGKAPKEIHAILTETLACFLPGRAKDSSAPQYSQCPLAPRRRSPDTHAWVKPKLLTHRECGLRFHPLLHTSHTADRLTAPLDEDVSSGCYAQ